MISKEMLILIFLSVMHHFTGFFFLTLGVRV